MNIWAIGSAVALREVLSFGKESKEGEGEEGGRGIDIIGWKAELVDA